jgi:beta-mannosidase
MYYSAKDIYEPVIIFPYLNDTTQNLDVWVTSDLWESVTGTAEFSWIDWVGNGLSLPYGDSASPATAQSTFKTSFSVGPINATRVLTYSNISSIFEPARDSASSSNSTASINNALLRLQVTASPSRQQATKQQPWPGPGKQDQYIHTYWFHPASLATSNIRDPGLKLSHKGYEDNGDNISQDSGIITQKSVTFTVKAETAVAAWVWLDYSSSQVQGLFDYNGFWLNKGESKDISFLVYNDWTGDGSWVDSVTVRSLYDNLVD